MSADILQIIVQAGAVGITLILIFYIYKKDKLHAETLKNYSELLSNHVSHMETAISELSSEIKRANDNYINIAGVLDRNTQAFGQIIRVLDKYNER